MEEKRPMDVTIGNNLAKLREQFQLTQQEIAQVVGANRSTYKQYENGYRMIPISVLRELAKFYRVPSNYFFDNMPKLSDKEQRELFQYSYSVGKMDSKAKYLVLQPPKEVKKYLAEQQKKIQARARLRIRNLRLENNKTQKDISEHLGIDISTYNKYEKGTRKLNNEVVRAIAEFYNIQVSDIVD